jgi:hypothetical protein
MQQLDGDSGCLCKLRVVIGTRVCNGQTQFRANPRTPREHGMANGADKLGGAIRGLAMGDSHCKGMLDAGNGFHEGLRWLG